MNSSNSKATRRFTVPKRAAVVLTVLFCWAGRPAIAQEAKPQSASHDQKALVSDVEDTAKLFGAEAVASARKELRRIESETKVATIIETIETLKGGTIDDETHRVAERRGIQGVFALITKKEKHIEILVSSKYAGALTPPRRDAIRTAFIDGFRQQQFDDGLQRGVAAIDKALAAARAAGELPTQEAALLKPGPMRTAVSGSATTGALVVRDQIKLTLAGARVLLAAARDRARFMRLKVNIAVVDDGGHLIAFERMDGAPPASISPAIDKATSAATSRQPSGPLPAGTSEMNSLLHMSIQNTAEGNAARTTILLGGVPVVVDDQIIGAVGIGGGSGEQNAEIARAGVNELLHRLGPPAIDGKDSAEPRHSP
jgi:uncharacterized protein GlcG (DUF336 family)